MSTTPDTNQSRTDDGYPGMPKWVKWTLVGVLALLVILTLVAVLVGGDHGPGRHMSAPAPTAATDLLLGR